MKLKIKISGFMFTPEYFTKMLGVVHKWLVANNIHDNISLYTYSHVHRDFFTFTSYDKELQIKLLFGAINDNKMFDNVKFTGFERMPIIIDKEIFKCASPFFVKENDKHLIFKDAEKRAKEILITKAKKAKVNLKNFDIEFVNFRKTKLIKIHDISNKCFVSEIKITGNDVVKKFACQVGIGSSTGSGFGMIY